MSVSDKIKELIKQDLASVGWPHIPEEQVLSMLPRLYKKIEDAGYIEELASLGVRDIDYASFERSAVVMLNTYRIFGEVPSGL